MKHAFDEKVNGTRIGYTKVRQNRQKLVQGVNQHVPHKELLTKNSVIAF